MRHALGSSYRHDLSCGDLFHSAGLVARVIIEFVCFPHPMLYSLRELKENDTYIFSTTFLFLEASLSGEDLSANLCIRSSFGSFVYPFSFEQERPSLQLQPSTTIASMWCSPIYFHYVFAFWSKISWTPSTPSLHISSGAVMTSTVIGIRSPTITCPACVGKTHRSTRHGLRDFCYRLVGFYPFRCWDCGHRFYRCRRR